MNIARACVAFFTAVLVSTSGTACTGTSRSGSDAPGVKLPAPASAGPAVAERTSISQSSAKDIAAMFRANGIAEPEHWAKVVTDHSPYPPDDPSLAKLHALLDQEHADPALAQKIVDLLAP